MISYIKGELSEIAADGIVVETGGIGYEIKVPALRCRPCHLWAVR